MPYANKEKRLKYIKLWQKDNKEKVLLYKKNWRIKNKRKVKKYRNYWFSKNPNYKNIWRKSLKAKLWRREYDKEQLKDSKFKISKNMRMAIGRSLKGNKNNKSWESLVDYSTKELMEHLEELFDKKMNWNNYGSYWQIDHIKPISLFDYTKSEDYEFKQCWSLENLQPLEKIENIKKSSKYIKIDSLIFSKFRKQQNQK